MGHWTGFTCASDCTEKCLKFLGSVSCSCIQAYCIAKLESRSSSSQTSVIIVVPFTSCSNIWCDLFPKALSWHFFVLITRKTFFIFSVHLLCCFASWETKCLTPGTPLGDCSCEGGVWVSVRPEAPLVFCSFIICSYCHLCLDVQNAANHNPVSGPCKAKKSPLAIG